MGALLRVITIPFIAIFLLAAAITEPTVGGEIVWIWWILDLLGVFSLAGWILQKGK